MEYLDPLKYIANLKETRVYVTYEHVTDVSWDTSCDHMGELIHVPP